MAKITMTESLDLEELLNRAENNSFQMCAEAVQAGASIVADEVRKNLKAIPEETFRMLKQEEKFQGIPKGQKEDLERYLGITPVDVDRKGFINVKVGFQGYGSYPTKKYPKGIPIKLLARAVESGSSVRKKTPFVRPAAVTKKQEVVEAMQKEITDNMEN